MVTTPAVWQIFCHDMPIHLDEIAAWRLFTLEGQEKFPGIQNAPLQLVKRRDQLFTLLRTPATILLGVGGPEARLLGDQVKALVLDEHEGLTEQGRKECATTMAAQHVLSAERMLLWEPTLKLVQEADAQNLGPYHLERMVVAWQTEDKEPFEDVVLRASKEVERGVTRQERFFDAIMRQVEQCPLNAGGQSHTVTFLKGKEGEDPQSVDDLLRVVLWQGSALVVVRRATGHVAMLENAGVRLRGMEFLARMVRSKELDNLTPTGPKGWEQLGQYGSFAGWYFEKRTDGHCILLNGAPNHPEVPPTRLSDKDIQRLVLQRAFNTLFVTGWAQKHFQVRP